MSTEPGPADQAWHRWGWLVGTIWLVFLVFPVTILLSVQPGWGPRALGLTLIVAFGAAYTYGFIRINRCEDGAWRGTTPVVAVMSALTIGVGLLIGVDALGMVPFIISFAIWAYRWPRGLWVGIGLTVASCATLVLGSAFERWFYPLLLVLVLGFGALMRMFDRQSERQTELAELMAVVGERERVARDVHDVLGHSLTAISIKAELAQRLIDVDADRARTELGQVQTLAREALAEIRSTVSGLRATRIDDELAAARDSLEAAGICAELPGSADGVQVAHRVVLAWALREAITNVLRHSGARRCVVTLGPSCLVVTDDGDRSPGPEGNGLRGVRERVAAAGGTVDFGPGADGRGHELRVAL